jgi:hypothetical protein
MPDPIQAPGGMPQPQSAGPAKVAAQSKASGFKGIDLSQYLLSSETCIARNKSANKVHGLDVALFPQCGSAADLAKSIFYVGCEYQSKSGVTWSMKAETGEIETNCPGRKVMFMKREFVDIEVDLNANAIADSDLMDWVQGRRAAMGGAVRTHGFGSIRSYMLVLIDSVSSTMSIYPDVQYVPTNIDIKYAYDAPPTMKLMFTASLVDLGDGSEPFFSEVRSFVASPARP